MSDQSPFAAKISEDIWDQKYRLKTVDGRILDADVDATFRRVAKAAASVEKGGAKARKKWANTFYTALADFGFLPAGRILAGAGTKREVTLFNCFVMGQVPDNLTGIFRAVEKAALTMQAGGGIGQDFSTLRPKGAPVKSIDADASGPVSFMDVWDAMCQTIMSAGARRGAMMGTMRIDHPDIEDFVAAKQDAKHLRNFNLSVLVTDSFMQAVADDASWDLIFDGKVFKSVRARDLWNKIVRATYEYAEPGVIFIDRINQKNNLNYCEEIFATNPCGEQPLPEYGACLLGSINLVQFIEQPFEEGAGLSIARLQDRVRCAVRLLDNIIDVSQYPLKKQKKEAKNKRRIGLGLTGLADALIMTGLRYDSAEGRKQAQHWMRVIQTTAYEASIQLAKEKGSFPAFDCEAFLKSSQIKQLDASIAAGIKKHGLRNGCLTSIAPTGTISLFAGNVSSGIEPVFDFSYQRRILNADGSAHTERVEDYAHARFVEMFGPDMSLPDTFVVAEELSTKAHLAMQAAMQPFVDSAISKTINCAESISFADFKNIYQSAYELGLKGCTTYRPNDVTGAVLSRSTSPQDGGTDQDAEDSGVATQEKTNQPVVSIVDPERGLPADNAARAPTSQDDVVYLAKKLERPTDLEGRTYKLKWPNGGQTLYVTINDIQQGHQWRPFEIFINTRNLEHYAWTVALTRMISAVFRRGGDVTFVAQELKEIFDPQGGCWMDGNYVPSLLAAIGNIIEDHMVSIGFLERDETTLEEGERNSRNNEEKLEAQVSAINAPRTNKKPVGHLKSGSLGDADRPQTLRESNRSGHRTSCTRCGAHNLAHREGCLICRQCGYSSCG